jgi:hypothetical protein
MESEIGQPVTLIDIRHVDVSGDEKAVVLTTQGEQAFELELQLDDVGT